MVLGNALWFSSRWQDNDKAMARYTKILFFSELKAKTAFKRSTLKNPYHLVLFRSSQIRSIK